MKIDLSNFDKHDWACMHDCIFNATYETTKKQCTQEELEVIFAELPEEMQCDALKWGMSDTPWRDSLYEWYQEKELKA